MDLCSPGRVPREIDHGIWPENGHAGWERLDRGWVDDLVELAERGDNVAEGKGGGRVAGVHTLGGGGRVMRLLEGEPALFHLDHSVGNLNSQYHIRVEVNSGVR